MRMQEVRGHNEGRLKDEHTLTKLRPTEGLYKAALLWELQAPVALSYSQNGQQMTFSDNSFMNRNSNT